MVAASKETRADLNARIGLLYLVKAELETAKKYFEAAITLCPEHYLYHYYMALYYGRTNNRKEMLASFRKAVENLEYKKPEKSAAKQWLHSVAGTLFVDNKIC